MVAQDNNFDVFLAQPSADRSISIKISRNTLLAIVFSLLLHSILLWVALPKLDSSNPFPKSDTIEVTLAPPPKAIVPTKDVPPPKVEEVTPKVMAKKPTIQPSKPKPKDFSVPKVMTQRADSPQKAPEPPPIAPRPPQPAEATDMMALVNKNRALREAAESEASSSNEQAASAERGLTNEEKRNKRIAENFKTGTNGLFEIRRIDALGASIKFRGWTSDYNSATTQYFDVPSQAGQDTRLLVIRRVIAVIKEHYDGDFPWDSHRLDRTITLSVRPQDRAYLEDFLMTEFFGVNYKNQ
jgi:hypothetical protein